MATDKPKGKDNWNTLILWSVVIFFAWFGSWLLIKSFITGEDKQGQFGDQFGAINALFSGLAFAGIIYTILLQKKELSLQRKELRETRQEFVTQNQTLKRQQIENTFFNLIKIQEDIINSMEHTLITKSSPGEIIKEKTVKNRQLFHLMSIEFKAIYKIISSVISEDKYDKKYFEDTKETFIWDIKFKFRIRDNEIYKFINEGKFNNQEAIIVNSYSIFFEYYHHIIGHYFRHLYHILKFLKSHEDEDLYNISTNKAIIVDADRKALVEKDIKNEYKSYADYIQSQMSSSELFLLFYNGLFFKNIKPLIEHYNFLENLAIEDLLSEDHKKLYDINFKSRINLLK